MKAVFWISAALVIYVYAGYPLLLALWAHLRPRRLTVRLGGRLPSVSIVIAARNEGHRLAARIDNILSLDYPPELRQVIVVSNGSDDATPDVLKKYRSAVDAYSLPPVGKAAALNLGAAAATGEILVFADARQRFAPDALRRLVEPFSDPSVGSVSGELLIDGERAAGGGKERTAASPVAEGVGLYWRYEKWLRQQESQVGSTLGVTGAIHAMRRSAWRCLPPETLLDDVLAPMRVALAGQRVVFAPAARAYDVSSPDAETERRRKVRTLAGNFQLMWLEPALLSPLANPVWLQFVSHKVGRLVVPYALAALLVASAALAREGLFYGLALTLQVAFYVLAAHGAVVSLAAPPPPAKAVGPAAADEELVHANAD